TVIRSRGERPMRGRRRHLVKYRRNPSVIPTIRRHVMGSTKLQICGSLGWMWGLICCFLITTTAATAASDMNVPARSDMNIPARFDDVPAVEKWAHDTFIGGFERDVFSHDGKSAMTIIGQSTSGIATSVLIVLEKDEMNGFVPIVIRRR